ncbi:hypothetical protein BHM03_00055921 [Ensete ventricosum]|nr:hypothetical protein BHM03_00055921 [Ensete ventricosum]
MFQSVFCAPSRKFKILAIPDVLAHGKSYEQGFAKKLDGHNLFAMSDAGNVEFRSVFRTPSQKFKILAIPNVLAHRKSYEYGFTKKCDGHKLFTKSTFNQFFVHPLENSKYWLFQTY